jgi:hypothetical protein
LTVVKPAAAAVTVYGPPAVALAVNAADATPEAFVATVIVAVLLLNVPDAPEPGAVNVTFTPDVGLPPVVTVTAKAFAKAVLTVADCGVVPVLAVIDCTVESVTAPWMEVCPTGLPTVGACSPKVGLRTW